MDPPVALYEYGKDSIPASEGYLRQILPLTDDLDEVSKQLFALTTNGVLSPDTTAYPTATFTSLPPWFEGAKQ